MWSKSTFASRLLRNFFLIVIVFLIASCSRESDTIYLGHASPLSGNQAETGIDMMRGAELAIEDLNKTGGILGKKIKLVALDDKADPKEAVSVAHRLASDENIIAVVGHLNSGCSIPASTVYHDNGLAMITPVSTADKLTQQGFDNIFRIPIRNSDQGPAAAKFAVEKLGMKKFIVLDDKSSYGDGIADEFERASKDIGGTIVKRESITEGDMDFRGILSRFRGETIDAIYFGGMYPEGSLLIKQAKELGVQAPFISGDGLFAPKLIEVAGKAAEGAIVTFIAPLEAANQQARDFFVNFKTKFGEEVKVYAPLSYDAVMVLAEALRKSGKISRRSIIDELHKPNFTYLGVTGEIRFDEKGDTIGMNPFFYVVKDGTFKLMEQ